MVAILLELLHPEFVNIQRRMIGHLEQDSKILSSVIG